MVNVYVPAAISKDWQAVWAKYTFLPLIIEVMVTVGIGNVIVTWDALAHEQALENSATSVQALA